MYYYVTVHHKILQQNLKNNNIDKMVSFTIVKTIMYTRRLLFA